MSEYNYPVKRAIGHPDPRMIVQSGYGGFQYHKVIAVGDNYAIWFFDSEAGRAKFVKDYGGEAVDMNDDCVPVYYQPAYKAAMSQPYRTIIVTDPPGADDYILDPLADLRHDLRVARKMYSQTIRRAEQKLLKQECSKDRWTGYTPDVVYYEEADEFTPEMCEYLSKR